MAARLAVLLAATVRLTLPSLEADTSVAGDRCAPGVRALADLDSLFVWAQVRGNPRETLIYRARVRGLEGSVVSIPITFGAIATVWAVTSDTAGNRACASNRVGVNLVAGVPGPPAAPALEWFDVAGRRLREKPAAPGVYFWRRGRERGVRLVLR